MYGLPTLGVTSTRGVMKIQEFLTKSTGLFPFKKWAIETFLSLLTTFRRLLSNLKLLMLVIHREPLKCFIH
jgi:hypothetical protein